MARRLLCLVIFILLINLGLCYVPVKDGGDKHVKTQTSCEVDAIEIGLTDDALQCFPEPTMDKPRMAENGTICLLPRPVPTENELSVDDTLAAQCVNGWWTDGDLGNLHHAVELYRCLVGCPVGDKIPDIPKTRP